MSVNIAQQASFTINGVTPAAGMGFTLLANPSLSTSNITQGDYFAETFTINPSTTATSQSLGDIATASVLWIQTDQPVTVTLVQTSGSNTFVVDSFLFVNATFTGIQFANPNTTTAAHINLVVTGSRVTNPGTPGIW